MVRTRRSRARTITFAEVEGEEKKEAQAPATPERKLVEEKEPTPRGLQPGQGTAIVTGAISLILGIAYIALSIALDSRGGALQPPPPEAFMQ
jgi:hypothetical protein